MGAGIGLAMAGQLAQQMVNPQNSQPVGVQPQNPLGFNPQQNVPPPMPPQTMYHVAVGGVQQGPFPVIQLQQMVQQAQLTRETLVWTTGMAGWAVANSVPQLSQLFGAVPPPL